MDTYNLRLLVSVLTLFLGSVTSKKHKIGPCLLVTDDEPCPDADYISVHLYTKETHGSQRVYFDDKTDNLDETDFNANVPNKLIIHGFDTDIFLDVLQDIREGYMNVTEDYNVFMVNYPKYVQNLWCYLTAVKNIQHVGKCVAQFVGALRRRAPNPHVHVIGFSLGAQLANYIAKNLGGQKLDRITVHDDFQPLWRFMVPSSIIPGLDPAGPGFVWRNKKKKLDPSDAHFVDVIHTNGGIQGYIQTCGDVDFYVNGGVLQPGCMVKDHKSEYLNCNHRRSAQYFAESITTKVGFYGWKCSGYVNIVLNNCNRNKELILMGEKVPIGSKGKYMVRTGRKKPFALGKKAKEINKNY